MHETMEKFGWPNTQVAEFEHWIVLARPAQPTLGALVLVAKSDVLAFGELPEGAHAELKQVTSTIEAALSTAVQFEKINYLMLMMVDPQVHFHVIPRYEGERTWQGHSFVDAGWPKVPDLGKAISLDGVELNALTNWLKTYF